MSTEEQEIPLIMQRDHLSPPELRHGREQGPKQPPDVHPEQGREIVQDEFGGMRRGSSVPADLLAEDDACEFKVGRRAGGKVDDGDGV